ncbi:universal stress protein [Sphingobium algorifonticola]|uniref:Universal stress protein n=1 Tax=Sphingobium algorifonticola TaxID=2008318 RepID=A0A437J4C8_9SPHN|nr:universal stress protein [Sphingobium algorifonticola]RVT39555.1 universal stress protein [Sphingobium algorifonticola]
MKNILLLLHDDVGQEARLQAALDLTRSLDGHLTCLDVAILPALMGDPYCQDGSAILLQEERAREDVNQSRIRERLDREDVSWEIAQVTGDLAPCLSDAAGLADLIVVNRKLDEFPYPDMANLVGELVVKSGKPVIAVPDDIRSFNAAGRAIVAWDGSPASMAALQAATPLLKLSESVIIVEIDDGSLKTPAREAAAYLSQHGIHALIRLEKSHGRSAGDILLSEIRDRSIDYLVMGGFGHRRFVEALFGGVTRTLLEKSPVPLFLAHG